MVRTVGFPPYCCTCSGAYSRCPQPQTTGKWQPAEVPLWFSFQLRGEDEGKPFFPPFKVKLTVHSVDLQHQCTYNTCCLCIPGTSVHPEIVIFRGLGTRSAACIRDLVVVAAQALRTPASLCHGRKNEGHVHRRQAWRCDFSLSSAARGSASSGPACLAPTPGRS